MLFRELSSYYDRLEAVSSRLEMIDILSELFKSLSPEEVPIVVHFTQGVLAAPFEGIEFGVAEKTVEDAIAIATGYPKADVEKSFRKSGDLGQTAEEFQGKTKLKSISQRKHSISDVYGMMRKIAESSGPGSKEAKTKLLANLIASSSGSEPKYLVRYPLGILRLGVGDSTILEALSVMATGDRKAKPQLERAYNLCSDLAYIGGVLANKGIDAVKNMHVTLFKPIRPALAERLPTAEQILEKMGGKASVEQKYDGFRVQIHKDGKRVMLFSRKLEQITYMFPDVVKAVLEEIKAPRAILEGEAIAFNEATQQFMPFQETIQRKRKHGIEEKAEQAPLHVFAFDIMYLDGKDMMDAPYKDRRDALERLLKGCKRITPSGKIVTDSAKEFEKFFETSVENGLEGVIAKDLGAAYVAGARGYSWIKIKRSYRGELSDTLDLVIVGYFLGKGARAEFQFGGLLCAAYNKSRDMFETISRIGTGFSEKKMADFKKLLDRIKVKHRPARVDSLIEPDFWVDPKYVVTVNADEITLSPMHTCGRHENKGKDAGYALRFPRIVGEALVREDKAPEDATTTKEVMEMYRDQKRVGVASAEA
ncbi:MAG: ATP-dependent DNA ligase [Candidatus Micrarchaeota archaeon]|nr:ATP-dependent DNA ligase [Candidatus Micrarchaeota archaeon]